MFVEAEGARLFASSFGAGDRTVLALGGWIGGGEIWQEVLGVLSGSWRAATFDQRGSGTSHVANRRDISPGAWVDDVFTVMDALGIERCLLLSDSSGCFPAILAALRQPERFSGLVLVGGAPRMPMDRTRRLFKAALFVAPRRALRGFAQTCLPEDETGHVRQWLWDICVRADSRSAIRLLDVLAAFDVGAAAPRLSTPTLVVHGSRDRVQPPSDGRALASLIPGSDLVVLEGLGHVPMMSRPAEIAALIEGWVRERGI